MKTEKPHTVLQNYINTYLKLESLGGILIIGASIFAIILANTKFQADYFAFLESTVSFGLNEWRFQKSVLHWINDGLMALFFVLIGLELKREMIEGHLAKLPQVILPSAAALGGIVVPAVIYVFFNHGDGIALRGWAIPTATDIAFALSMLSLFGSRVPQGLKIFLMTVAIFDDIAAVLIIAFFYTSSLSLIALLLAIIAVLVLLLMNKMHVIKVPCYFFVGILLWVCVLKSGVHATLAGFVFGLTIPLQVRGSDFSPLRHLETKLHGWVTYLIVPLFAFSNAGISFGDLTVPDLFTPLSIGITLGLFLGKQLGIFSFTWIFVRARLGHLPENVTWPQVYGVSLLCGIGFTMSLFISALAFQTNPEYIVLSRLGIFCGTIGSAVFGLLILRRYLR